ncbi:hypothetical protein ACIBG8_19635 [Nonomuraea sp. NPDC050556]|uniref:hypothetical protein n=1 Tax=Nonomuraea sp. NPDC050556 TaxID=3364369 RepID=UPI00379ABE57
MASFNSPNPSEHGWPFPGGPGQVVTQGNWKSMAKTWQSNGVVGKPELGGVPSAGNRDLFAVKLTATQVEVQPGVASIDGYYFDLASPKAFDIDITGADFADDGTGKLIRRDLVALKVDETTSAFRFVQIKNAINQASGSWKVNLNDARTEIPLFEVAVEKDVGVTTIKDRRWFLSQRIRPMTFEQPGFEPVPAEGALGVDATGSRLVIGKGGQWVSAREVFTNDIPAQIATRLGAVETSAASLDTRVSGHDGQLTTLTTFDTAIKSKLAVRPVTLDAPQDTGSWDTTGTFAYVFGPILYVHLTVTKKGADLAAQASAGSKLAILSFNHNLPTGLTIAKDTYARAFVSAVVSTTALPDVWVRMDSFKELTLWKCPTGVKLNATLQSVLTIPLNGFTL